VLHDAFRRQRGQRLPGDPTSLGMLPSLCSPQERGTPWNLRAKFSLFFGFYVNILRGLDLAPVLNRDWLRVFEVRVPILGWALTAIPMHHVRLVLAPRQHSMLARLYEPEA